MDDLTRNLIPRINLPNPPKIDLNAMPKMLPAVARFSPAAVLAVELSRRGLKPGTEEFATALEELVAATRAAYKALSEDS